MLLSKMSINLTKYTAEFVLEKIDLPDTLRMKIETGKSLSENEAYELRELCADELSLKGFNSDYSVNWTGKRLEDLIDVLYTE